jgi:hypothetical protein
MNRNRLVKIKVPNSGLVVETFIDYLNSIVSKWHSNRDEFLNQLGKKLSVNTQERLDFLQSHYGFNVLDETTWNNNYSVDQIIILAFTEFYKPFYSKTIKNAYLSIAKDEWCTKDEQHNRRARLAHEYSLLLNLLYLEQLAQIVDVSCLEGKEIKKNLLSFYIYYDYKGYNQAIQEIQIIIEKE